jgi:adenine C2-methylase RlmN of 23S rRNA A2503 and tRNA A37
MPDIEVQRPLKNAKHEAFAQKVATGMSYTEAYQKVFKVNTASAGTCGSRLLQKVKTRINSIISGQKLKSTHLTIERKRDDLASIWETPIANIDEHHPFCQSYKRTVNDDGRVTTEYRMIDKLRALQIDNELAGHTAVALQQHNINIQNNINNTLNVAIMSEPRRRELMDKKRAAIEKRRGALPLKSAHPGE